MYRLILADNDNFFLESGHKTYLGKVESRNSNEKDRPFFKRRYK